MSAVITADSWLQTLAAEYLETFIPAGGAAVKFAVAPSEDDVTTLAAQIADQARNAGFVVATVRAADVRLHMLDKFFGAVAQQVPWRELATARLAAMATSSFSVPARLSPAAVARQLAAANDVDEAYVRMIIGQRIAQDVFRDRELARDFRIAMTWLCRAVLEGGPEGETQIDDIVAWLSGEVRQISAMKPYTIYTKVNRTNARHHFESLFTWVRRADCAGTAVIVDGARFTRRERAVDGSVNYTRNALLDAYEVFRQFIDSTDDMHSAVLVAVMAPEFDTTEFGSGVRGLGAYTALLNRIYDEVRDRRHVNPMSSLVRIGGGA